MTGCIVIGRYVGGIMAGKCHAGSPLTLCQALSSLGHLADLAESSILRSRSLVICFCDTISVTVAEIADLALEGIVHPSREVSLVMSFEERGLYLLLASPDELRKV